MHTCIPPQGLMSQTGECRQQKHTQHAPSPKTECDYLYGWIKNTKQNKTKPPPPPPKKKKNPKKQKTSKQTNKKPINKQKQNKQTKKETKKKKKPLTYAKLTQSNEPQRYN